MKTSLHLDVVVRAERLGYAYSPESSLALQDVSLGISRGQLVAILGANGSGKSTLAKLLAGLLVPSQGSLEVLGCDLADLQNAGALRGRVGIVFQSPDQQMVATTMEREIAFGPENLGLPPEEIRRRVQSLKQQFRLESLSNRLPHQLSGGEKQRLALAAVLAMQPELLILDEVTSLLDPSDRMVAMHHIQKLKGQHTIVMITQFAEEAMIADWILMMHHGRIAQQGSPREVFAQATTDEIFGVEVPLIHQLLQLMNKESSP